MGLFGMVCGDSMDPGLGSRSRDSGLDFIRYPTCIKPHFEYRCTIWGNSIDYNQYKLEKITKTCLKNNSWGRLCKIKGFPYKFKLI